MGEPNYLPLTLALVGKVGNGKSSSANSILGRKEFKTSNNANSCTYLTTPSFVKRGSLEIKVVDSPGFQDPDGDQELEIVVTQIPGIMSVCPEGFHALILVLNYASKYTKEEKDTVRNIKQIFGENILRDYGIIIMTRGENFDMDGEIEQQEHTDKGEDATPTTFEKWRAEQTGAIQDLFAECDNRVVLFYNSGIPRYAEKQKIAVDQLLNIAVEISKKGVYCNEKFQECKLERDRLILEYKLPELNIEFQRKLDFLVQDINKLHNSNSMTEEDLIHLKELSKNLFDEIDKISLGTELLDELKEKVMRIRQGIDEIDLKQPIAKQLKPLLKLLNVIKDPPIALAVGATILGCLLLTAGIVLTVTTGGAAGVVGAVVVESAAVAAGVDVAAIVATCVGTASLQFGILGFLKKLLRKKKAADVSSS